MDVDHQQRYQFGMGKTKIVYVTYVGGGTRRRKISPWQRNNEFQELEMKTRESVFVLVTP